jgi:hypothetical protein
MLRSGSSRFDEDERGREALSDKAKLQGELAHASVRDCLPDEANPAALLWAVVIIDTAADQRDSGQNPRKVSETI